MAYFSQNHRLLLDELVKADISMDWKRDKFQASLLCTKGLLMSLLNSKPVVVTVRGVNSVVSRESLGTALIHYLNVLAPRVSLILLNEVKALGMISGLLPLCISRSLWMAANKTLDVCAELFVARCFQHLCFRLLYSQLDGSMFVAGQLVDLWSAVNTRSVTSGAFDLASIVSELGGPRIGTGAQESHVLACLVAPKPKVGLSSSNRFAGLGVRGESSSSDDEEECKRSGRSTPLPVELGLDKAQTLKFIFEFEMHTSFDPAVCGLYLAEAPKSSADRRVQQAVRSRLSLTEDLPDDTWFQDHNVPASWFHAVSLVRPLLDDSVAFNA